MVFRTKRYPVVWHNSGGLESDAALEAEVWVETVTKGGRRFMAAWRKEEEVDAARLRQERREAKWLGNLLLSCTGSVEPAKRHQFA